MAGSEIALSWSQMQLKILRWRPEFMRLDLDEALDTLM